MNKQITRHYEARLQLVHQEWRDLPPPRRQMMLAQELRGSLHDISGALHGDVAVDVEQYLQITPEHSWAQIPITVQVCVFIGPIDE